MLNERLEILGLLLFAVLISHTVYGHPPILKTVPTPLVSTIGDAYDSKFDNVDLNEILSQDRLLNNYVKCLENAGPCTPDANMLKGILPDAILTDCEKCTLKQKIGAEKVTRHLIDNRPEDWMRLEKIYDPQGSYRINYQISKSPNTQMDQNTETKGLDQVQGDS